jgi:hypothetical protein
VNFIENQQLQAITQKHLFTCAAFCALFAKRKDVATVAAPGGGEVGECLESMGNPVVKLLLVWIHVGLGLGDTLCNNLFETLAMTGIFAVYQGGKQISKK